MCAWVMKKVFVKNATKILIFSFKFFFTSFEFHKYSLFWPSYIYRGASTLSDIICDKNLNLCRFFFRFLNILRFSEARDQHENNPDVECQKGGRTRTTARILFLRVSFNSILRFLRFLGFLRFFKSFKISFWKISDFKKWSDRVFSDLFGPRYLFSYRKIVYDF